MVHAIYLMTYVLRSAMKDKADLISLETIAVNSPGLSFSAKEH